MANKRTSASDKAHHMTYKSQKIWERNRKRKLERTLKAQPDNKQVVAALAAISYRRGTPKAPQWNHTDMAMAQLIKGVSGFCDKGIFHANKDIKNAAWTNISSKRPKITTAINSNVKGMFSIKARAHLKGAPVWVS